MYGHAEGEGVCMLVLVFKCLLINHVREEIKIKFTFFGVVFFTDLSTKKADKFLQVRSLNCVLSTIVCCN